LEHCENRSLGIGFGDPVLTSVVERALEQNLDLAAALARVDQARAAARGAGAAPPGFTRSVSLYDIGLAASWKTRRRDERSLPCGNP
jgi:hypothetical protein